MQIWQFCTLIALFGAQYSFVKSDNVSQAIKISTTVPPPPLSGSSGVGDKSGVCDARPSVLDVLTPSCIRRSFLYNEVFERIKSISSGIRDMEQRNGVYKSIRLNIPNIGQSEPIPLSDPEKSFEFIGYSSRTPFFFLPYYCGHRAEDMMYAKIVKDVIEEIYESEKRNAPKHVSTLLIVFANAPEGVSTDKIEGVTEDKRKLFFALNKKMKNLKTVSLLIYDADPRYKSIREGTSIEIRGFPSSAVSMTSDIQRKIAILKSQGPASLLIRMEVFVPECTTEYFEKRSMALMFELLSRSMRNLENDETNLVDFIYVTRYSLYNQKKRDSNINVSDHCSGQVCKAQEKEASKSAEDCSKNSKCMAQDQKEESANDLIVRNSVYKFCVRSCEVKHHEVASRDNIFYYKNVPLQSNKTSYDISSIFAYMGEVVERSIPVKTCNEEKLNIDYLIYDRMDQLKKLKYPSRENSNSYVLLVFFTHSPINHKAMNGGHKHDHGLDELRIKSIKKQFPNANEFRILIFTIGDQEVENSYDKYAGKMNVKFAKDSAEDSGCNNPLITVEFFRYNHMEMAKIILERIKNTMHRNCEAVGKENKTPNLTYDGNFYSVEFLLPSCISSRIDLRIYRHVYFYLRGMFRSFESQVDRNIIAQVSMYDSNEITDQFKTVLDGYRYSNCAAYGAFSSYPLLPVPQRELLPLTSGYVISNFIDYYNREIARSFRYTSTQTEKFSFDSRSFYELLDSYKYHDLAALQKNLSKSNLIFSNNGSKLIVIVMNRPLFYDHISKDLWSKLVNEFVPLWDNSKKHERRLRLVVYPFFFKSEWRKNVINEIDMSRNVVYVEDPTFDPADIVKTIIRHWGEVGNCGSSSIQCLKRIAVEIFVPADTNLYDHTSNVHKYLETFSAVHSILLAKTLNLPEEDSTKNKSNPVQNTSKKLQVNGCPEREGYVILHQYIEGNINYPLLSLSTTEQVNWNYKIKTIEIGEHFGRKLSTCQGEYYNLIPVHEALRLARVRAENGGISDSHDDDNKGVSREQVDYIELLLSNKAHTVNKRPLIVILVAHIPLKGYVSGEATHLTSSNDLQPIENQTTLAKKILSSQFIKPRDFTVDPNDGNQETEKRTIIDNLVAQKNVRILIYTIGDNVYESFVPIMYGTGKGMRRSDTADNTPRGKPITTPPGKPITTPPGKPITTPPGKPITTPPGKPITINDEINLDSFHIINVKRLPLDGDAVFRIKFDVKVVAKHLGSFITHERGRKNYLRPKLVVILPGCLTNDITTENLGSVYQMMGDFINHVQYYNLNKIDGHSASEEGGSPENKFPFPLDNNISVYMHDNTLVHPINFFVKHKGFYPQMNKKYDEFKKFAENAERMYENETLESIRGIANIEAVTEKKYDEKLEKIFQKMNPQNHIEKIVEDTENHESFVFNPYIKDHVLSIITQFKPDVRCQIGRIFDLMTIVRSVDQSREADSIFMIVILSNEVELIPQSRAAFEDLIKSVLPSSQTDPLKRCIRIIFFVGTDVLEKEVESKMHKNPNKKKGDVSIAAEDAVLQLSRDFDAEGRVITVNRLPGDISYFYKMIVGELDKFRKEIYNVRNASIRSTGRFSRYKRMRIEVLLPFCNTKLLGKVHKMEMLKQLSHIIEQIEIDTYVHRDHVVGLGAWGHPSAHELFEMEFNAIRKPWIGNSHRAEPVSFQDPLEERSDPFSKASAFHRKDLYMAFNDGRVMIPNVGRIYDNFRLTFYLGLRIHGEMPHIKSLHLIENNAALTVGHYAYALQQSMQTIHCIRKNHLDLLYYVAKIMNYHSIEPMVMIFVSLFSSTQNDRTISKNNSAAMQEEPPIRPHYANGEPSVFMDLLEQLKVVDAMLDKEKRSRNWVKLLFYLCTGDPLPPELESLNFRLHNIIIRKIPCEVGVASPPVDLSFITEDVKNYHAQMNNLLNDDKRKHLLHPKLDLVFFVPGCTTDDDVGPMRLSALYEALENYLIVSAPEKLISAFELMIYKNDSSEEVEEFSKLNIIRNLKYRRSLIKTKVYPRQCTNDGSFEGALRKYAMEKKVYPHGIISVVGTYRDADYLHSVFKKYAELQNKTPTTVLNVYTLSEKIPIYKQRELQHQNSVLSTSILRSHIPITNDLKALFKSLLKLCRQGGSSTILDPMDPMQTPTGLRPFNQDPTKLNTETGLTESNTNGNKAYTFEKESTPSEGDISPTQIAGLIETGALPIKGSYAVSVYFSGFYITVVTFILTFYSTLT